MKPHRCFEMNASLEEAALRAEQRKHRAIERLNAKLGPAMPPGDAFIRARPQLEEKEP